MSEQVIEPTAPEVDQPVTGEPATDPAAEVEKWRSLARKHEARAKENATAAQRLAEIEEASKSDAQKAAEAAERTAKERDDAKAEAARLRAAVKFGLTEEDLAHLDGIPADRVESIAEWVASRAPAPKLPPAPPATGQGDVGKPIADGQRNQLSRADLAGMTPEQIESARAAGRLNVLLGIK